MANIAVTDSNCLIRYFESKRVMASQNFNEQPWSTLPRNCFEHPWSTWQLIIKVNYFLVHFILNLVWAQSCSINEMHNRHWMIFYFNVFSGN